MARDLPLRRTILSVTLVALSFVLVAPVAVRAESVLQSSFLKYAPADTAFYVACLRNREQVDIVKNSKAYERLMQNPFVMIGLGQVKNMWANPTDDDLREFKEFVEAPENQPLWKLMEDMVSDEIVFFGSGGWIDMVEFLSEKGAEFQAKINEFGGDEPSEEEVKEMIEVVAEYLDEIDIPDTVVAFQVNDTERAAGQLDRLEDLIRDALAEEDEELAGDILKRLKREKVAGGDFLTLSLDGKLIPWDEIKDEADLDAQGRELLEKIIPVLNKKTLVISLGIYKEYVLLSFGDSHAHIKALGKGKLLADTETFAPLGKHADKPITGIVYASEEMAQAGAPGEAQIDSWLSSIRAGLNETEIDEETKEDIITDANLFFAEIVAAMPEPGAYLDFTFLTDRGYEGYTYNWTENPYLDSTKPLNILQHVGSNPLFFYASRGTSGLEEYEWAVKWLKKAGGYVDRICEQELDQEELAQYRTVRKEAIPLLARLDKANRDQLIPGFADGSSALVFDAKVKSKKWHEELPESQTPTRMPEIAIV